MSDPLSILLDGLRSGAVDVIDLTQPLDEATVVIQLPEPFANTPRLSRRALSDFDEKGPDWAWNVLELGEHTGTHVDAPSHWITGRNGEDIGSVPARRLVGPALVIDRTAEVTADPGYLLDASDLDAFESEHGPIPPGSWLLLRTGWGARAQDETAFLNIGPDGPVTPGANAAAARWLAEHPNLVGFGVEQVGIDAGAGPALDPPNPVHALLLGAGRYGIAQLANLDRLPPTGALILVAPLRLVKGTASPARVIALVPA